jgi:release factor glutamine methyltransferase
VFKTKSYSGTEIFHCLVEALKPAWGGEAEALSRYILKEVMDFSLTEIVAKTSVNLVSNKAYLLDEIIRRLSHMEPIQYILGYAYFLDRKFILTPDVLIPRSETEGLILLVLEQIEFDNPKILDVGVGSGCIGISLALETGVSTFTGLDRDQSIIDVAERNAKAQGVKMNALRVNLLNEPISDSGFDIIISNPPYVLTSEKTYMKKNVLDFEPEKALFVPEDDPLIFYHRITEEAARVMNPGGMLFYEINEQFGIEVQHLLEELEFTGVEIKKDIHGKDRFVFGRLKNPHS